MLSIGDGAPTSKANRRHRALLLRAMTCLFLLSVACNAFQYLAAESYRPLPDDVGAFYARVTSDDRLFLNLLADYLPEPALQRCVLEHGSVPMDAYEIHKMRECVEAYVADPRHDIILTASHTTLTGRQCFE